MDILKYKSTEINGQKKYAFLHQNYLTKRIRKQPIFFVVNNSGEFVCLEDINSGDEIVGEPSKYEKDTYSTS